MASQKFRVRSVGKCIVLVIGLVVAVALTTSCAAGTSANSTTPRISLNDDEGDLSSYLLTGSDVAAIEALDLSTATDFNDVPTFENPDLRGPCGGVMPELDLAGAAGRAFVGTSSTAHAIVLESDAERRRVLLALQADADEPCGSFESTTNTGHTQLVSDISLLKFPVDDVDAVGWTSKIEVGLQSVYGGVWLFETDGRIALIQYVRAVPVSESAMIALAERAYERLKG